MEYLQIIGTFFIVYFTWKTTNLKKKEMGIQAPQIARLRSYGDDSLWFDLIITNNKPHNITIEDVRVDKPWFHFLWQSVNIEWTPENKKVETLLNNDFNNRIAWMMAPPLYSINDQQTLKINITDTLPANTYKFSVKTSAGTCQSIYRFRLKRPNE